MSLARIFLLPLGALIGVCLAGCATIAPSTAGQPELGLRTGTAVETAGLSFRDANASGTLEPY